jgi:hypothetical protein
VICIICHIYQPLIELFYILLLNMLHNQLIHMAMKLRIPQKFTLELVLIITELYSVDMELERTIIDGCCGFGYYII